MGTQCDFLFSSSLGRTVGPTGPFFPSCLPGTLLNTATYAQALSHVASLKGTFCLCWLVGWGWGFAGMALSPRGCRDGLAVLISQFRPPCVLGWCGSFSPSVSHSQGREQHLFPHMLSCLTSTWPEIVGITAPAGGLSERRLCHKGRICVHRWLLLLGNSFGF